MPKVFTIAHLPTSLEKLWMQHVRNFDIAHPGCHFEIGLDAPRITMSEAVEMMQVNPKLTFEAIFKKGSK